ncbi:MAG: hypothetical protein GC155_02145 [Alphaproteobacteria bacterium]|nr:hypothetical protein [Alphaproteobacteria bacterium]
MTPTNLVLIIGSLLAATLLLQPRLLKAPLWRATVTPLASIIGSGFLVSGPILADAAGNYAWLAMTGLCASAYVFGEAIRHNILHVEPQLAGDAKPPTKTLERVSDLTLSLAYFVSVAYYLNLFAAFALRLVDVTDPFWTRVGATGAISLVGIIGLLGGLRALEHLEISAVSVKLSLIAGLLLAMALSSGLAIHNGDFALHQLSHPRGGREIAVLLGLVILVQGFETSRYLGAAYDAQTRVRTMRWAQWISTAIYMAFILLMTPFFTGGLPAHGGETAIIDLLKPIGMAVGPLIILAALASQLSAAVADTNGAGGMIEEATRKRIRVNFANFATALVAIGITWVANIYEIITYASKVFVAFYAIQCLQAAISAWRRREPVRTGLFASGMMLALVVIVFAVPAGA